MGERFFKDQAETLVGQLVDAGVLGSSDPASTVVCLMLPRGVVLVDRNDPKVAGLDSLLDGSDDDWALNQWRNTPTSVSP